MHRSKRLGAVATLVAVTALVGLLAAPARPAGAEEPDIPYFTETTGADVEPPNRLANPVVGHFTDLVLDDIFWYAAGATKESIWTPCPDCESGPFTKRQPPLANQVAGAYLPTVGDFSGNGLDDIYWLSQSPGADYLWTATGSGAFSVRRFDAPTGDVYPILLPDSRSGEGKDDILWRAADPGALSRLWVFPDDGSGTARTRARMRIPEGEAVVGDFDGNGAADILWYPHTTSCRCPTPAAAASTDHLWRRASSTASGFTVTTMNIKGEYDPVVGRYSGQGDGRDDILWVGTYAPCCSSGTDRPDSLWEGRTSGAFTASTQSFPSAGGGFLLGHDTADTAIIIDFDLAQGANTANAWFDTTSGPVLRPIGSQLNGSYEPIIGRFVSADRADLLARGYGDEPATLFHPIF